jgi:methionine synthase II (cobalamin-independent)
MVSTVLAAGIATGIGSLPHRDPHAAAAVVLRCLPELPAVPQLPARGAAEGMFAPWLRGVDGLAFDDAGTPVVTACIEHDAVVPTVIGPESHAGLLALVAAARAQARPPRRLKFQITGPLTLGVGLWRAGVEARTAFALGSRAARAWARAYERYCAAALPETDLVVFFDEPALVLWRDDEGPYDRELATDVLSTALAGPAAVTGVHVCGPGDVRLAVAAGPDVVHLDIEHLRDEDSLALARFLDGGGWVAWGAVPSHRPVGEHPAPLWKALLDVWCELTRRGCDPVQLRAQALVAPACGLAGHGPSQAERAMMLARELGNRVHDQAAATKLAVGA